MSIYLKIFQTTRIEFNRFRSNMFVLHFNPYLRNEQIEFSIRYRTLNHRLVRVPFDLGIACIRCGLYLKDETYTLKIIIVRDVQSAFKKGRAT